MTRFREFAPRAWTCRLVLQVLVVLTLSAAALGQDDSPEGLLPVPDYSGDWKTRPYLSGDWGGLRTKWANRGVTLDLQWYQVGQGVVSGGIDERWAYGTNLDLFINLDLMRMDVVPGALISFRAQSRFGTTVNADTGLILPVNTYSFFPQTIPLDDDVPIAVTELNWTQFFSDHFGILLGKITTMANANEFAGGEGRSQFMNFQFIYPAVFAQVAPYSTPAVGAFWLPTGNVTVTSVVMNTRDASTVSGLTDLDQGTSWWTSVDYTYRAGGMPGGGTLGFIYAFDGDFARIGGINIDPEGEISAETKSEAWALLWDGWQYLYTEGTPSESIDPSDGRQDLQGLGVFLFLGLSDKTTNPVSFSIAGGLGGRGLIPGRDDDTCGLGLFHNQFQELRASALFPLRGSAEGLEAYYNVSVARSIQLTFDFQWARSALQSIDDAIVLGARLNLRF